MALQRETCFALQSGCTLNSQPGKTAGNGTDHHGHILIHDTDPSV